MELRHEQYEEIKPYLPVQRGNVKLSNRKVPKGFCMLQSRSVNGEVFPVGVEIWHTIYRRVNRGAKTGVLNRIFEAWPAKKIIPVRIAGYSLIAHPVKCILMEPEH